jgi:ribosomal protein S18 acetylase RimI-like enzyme
MTIFCSAQEFDSLLRDIAGKADIVRLQAKGGSMFPSIQSGDWVDIALGKDKSNGYKKGDLILFRREDDLCLHRVLKETGQGFMLKGDMSFGLDGIIPVGDILGRAVSIQRGKRRVDLASRPQRLLAAIAADASILTQYPLLCVRKLSSRAMAILPRAQSLKTYRRIAKKILNCLVIVRVAGPQDEEQLRDLYLMAGRDIREGLERIKTEGFWLVAQRGRRIVAGLTVSRSENDGELWIIFSLEVKPVFRGLGIGRMIVEQAVAKAGESGAKRIGLLVNKRAKAALGLYKTLGFKETQACPREFNRSLEELYLNFVIHE